MKLSDLKTDLAYPLKNSQASGKCLIHMKLTEMCSKSIDALVNSNRVCVCPYDYTVTELPYVLVCTGCCILFEVLRNWWSKLVF